MKEKLNTEDVIITVRGFYVRPIWNKMFSCEQQLRMKLIYGRVLIVETHSRFITRRPSVKADTKRIFTAFVII